ncbi:hypothetical protein KSS87_005477, partial [Heliosperma pusillum]
MWAWRSSKSISKTTCRRLSTMRKMHTHLRDDDGSWSYSPEWWGSDSDHHTHSIFRASSLHGNGVVSVISYPSSTPSSIHWPKTEDW